MYKNVNGNPCKPDCPNRTPTCKFDGSCNKYSEWRKEYDKHADKYFKAKELDKNIDEYRLHIHRRLNAGKIKTRRRNDDH